MNDVQTREVAIGQIETRLSGLADTATTIAGWLARCCHIEAEFARHEAEIQSAIDHDGEIIKGVLLQRKLRRSAGDLRTVIEFWNARHAANRAARRRLKGKIEALERQGMLPL